MKRTQRIMAWIGIILILAMYGATLFFALSDSPNAKGWLMASVFCTIVVPVIIYACMMIHKYLTDRK